MLYQSTGMVSYSINSINQFRVVLNIDQEITNYYRKLIPKARYVKKQGYAAHISIVRKQTPTELKEWGRHEGKTSEFLYENVIHNCETYYWLNCYCKLAEQIRIELGLPVYERESENCPQGFKMRFHTTLGNIKEV